MDVLDALTRLGGVADRSTLVRATSRREVEAALATEAVVVLARGRYALPGVDAGRLTAHALSGVLAGPSAALHWGWAVKVVPSKPVVVVPRSRKVRSDRAQLKFRDLEPREIVDGVTSPERTLADCITWLPLDEALSIADSALRDRAIGQHGLWALAEGLSGPGARQARKVAVQASPLSANPFESTLRSIGLGVTGLRLQPQVLIRGDAWTVRPDLVDERRRIVVEADSFEFHGTRQRLTADCHRYNQLTLAGWTVLRFAWEDVMLQPDYVQDCLVRAAQLPVAKQARRRNPDRKAA